MSLDHRIIYMTVGSEKEGMEIGRKLVEESLAACTNLLPGMKSCYRWEGKIEESSECVLIAKTKASLVEPLIELVKSNHSYDNPCILSIAVDGGARDFLNWISGQTS